MGIKFIGVLPVITGAISIGVALFGIKQVCDVVAQTKEQQEEICEVVDKAESEGFETDEEAIDAKMKLVSKVQENHKKVFIGATCIFGAVCLMGVTWAISAKADSITIDSFSKHAGEAVAKSYMKGWDDVSKFLFGHEIDNATDNVVKIFVDHYGAKDLEDFRAGCAANIISTIDPKALRDYGFEVKHV